MSKLRRTGNFVRIFMINIEECRILERTERFVAVYKPINIAVHPSDIHKHELTLFHIVKEMIGEYLYPVHRIDRATSGIVLFALTFDAASFIRQQFNEQLMRKEYLAVLRGHLRDQCIIDHAINTPFKAERKQAATVLEPLAHTELEIPSKRYATSRFSYIKALPKTGRWHQIRLHCSYKGYPIVGDVKHGDGSTNAIAREHFGCERLLLHAYRLEFQSEENGTQHSIVCPPDIYFSTILERMRFPL